MPMNCPDRFVSLTLPDTFEFSIINSSQAAQFYSSRLHFKFSVPCITYNALYTVLCLLYSSTTECVEESMLFIHFVFHMKMLQPATYEHVNHSATIIFPFLCEKRYKTIPKIKRRIRNDENP